MIHPVRTVVFLKFPLSQMKGKKSNTWDAYWSVFEIEIPQSCLACHKGSHYTVTSGF
jgi:hypothetical protein